VLFRSKFKEIGDMSLAGEPLLAVQSHQDLRLEVAVPSQCAAHLHLGQAVTVRIDTLAITTPAQVDEMSPEIDPQTRNQWIKIKLPPVAGLQAGYLGWLDQACEHHAALLIPSKAVIRSGQLEAVKVVVEGHINLRHIRTAKTIANKIEVISGLRAGETVVIQP
jgi:multidrug efflux pump subunit AcrA (membrane-fusion protein)